jgi:ABC-type amino acid transport substrate-binding protein
MIQGPDMKSGCGGTRRGLLWSACSVAVAGMIPFRGNAAQPLQTLLPDQLRIGTYFVNPPFEFIDHGKRVGFEVDLMNEVAKRLGLKPVFVDTRWEVILEEMQHNRYDCIIGGITITPERAKALAWSTPYMTTTLSLVVDTRRIPKVTSLTDLKHATVGVQAATTDYNIAVVMQREGQIGKVQVYPFARIGNAMIDLAAGRIGAVMKVHPVAAWLAHQHPGLRIIAEVPNDPQPLGVGFNRNNPGLLTAVNDALSGMQHDGWYQALVQRWGVV